MIRPLLLLLIVLCTAVTMPARANYFDCTVVYDEFDQLMMANFLVDPERYVSSIPNVISRQEHLQYQQNQFHLRKGRENAGIAIFLTNQNIRGKMLFFWKPYVRERLIPLEIDESISFGRVKDGYAPVRATAIYLTPGQAVDLDAAQLVSPEDETADFVYESDNEEFRIRAIPPAQLIFPVESMCHKVSE